MDLLWRIGAVIFGYLHRDLLLLLLLLNSLAELSNFLPRQPI